MTELRRIAPFRTYSIGQLCREFGCTTRALRFYEDQGLVFPRRHNGQRVYSYRDRARLQLVLRGRSVGLSLAQIRDILDAYDDDGEAAQAALALRVFKKRLEELEAERRSLDAARDTLAAACERLSAQVDIGQAA